MKVLNFANAADHVEWSLRDLSNDLISGFTIAFWANIASGATVSGAIIVEQNAAYPDLTQIAIEGGTDRIVIGDGSSGPFAWDGQAYLDEWHHYAFVFRAANIDLYVDGALVASGTGPLTRGFEKNSVMSIGQSHLGDLTAAVCKMSNLHIYLEELTVEKINKILQYQAYYLTNLEIYFKLDGTPGRFVNLQNGHSYSYISSGVTVENTNALDIYNFKYGEAEFPQAAFFNVLKEPQRTTIPKMVTAGEVLLVTGKDLSGCSILDLFITDESGAVVYSPFNPYAWYHFNESAGTTVKDSSTNGRDAILYPGSGDGFVGGKLGNAISYVGDTYVNAGQIGNFEWNEPFSLECWIYYTNDGYPRSIMGHIDRASATDRGYLLFVNDGYPTLYISNDASLGKAIYVYGNTQVPNAGWHHLVATYDGKGLAAGVKIYLDGILQVMGIANDNLSAGSIKSSANFAFGSANLLDWYFFGSIDESVIYDMELTQAQVSDRYNGGAGTEAMFAQAYSSPIPGTLAFPVPATVLGVPGEYHVQLKYGNDLFVDYTPIHTLEVLDTLG
jgi:hypothetical protein